MHLCEYFLCVNMHVYVCVHNNVEFILVIALNRGGKTNFLRQELGHFMKHDYCGQLLLCTSITTLEQLTYTKY